MARDKSQPYFTFPICCLQNAEYTIWDMPKAAAKRQAICIRYFAVWDLATGGWPEDDEQAYHIASRHSQFHLLKHSDDIGIRYLAAQVQLGVTLPDSPQSSEQLGPALCKWLPEEQRKLGTKRTRIRADILDDAASGRLPWKRFAYVCAVYAVCHAKGKRASSATVQQLTAMAHGYGSARYMPDGLQANQPTIRTQQRTVRDLSDKGGFFAMASPSNRANHFSISMSQEYLNRYCGTIAANKRQQKTAAAQSRESVAKAAADLVAKQQNEELATRRTIQADRHQQIAALELFDKARATKHTLPPEAQQALRDIERHREAPQQLQIDESIDRRRRQRKPK